MKVLIDQQFHLGHHYQYLGYLLPALVGIGQEVIVATTSEGRASKEFGAFLAPQEASVRFEPVLPAASPWLPMGERWRVHNDLRQAVRTLRPDYILMPSGDAQATAMSLFRMAGLGTVPGRVPCEVGIHFGSGLSHGPLKTRIRDEVNLLNLGLAGLRRIHLVNFLFYERARASAFGSRFTLMPHPVAVNPRLTKTESRRLLGLPEDGRYVGLAASIDSRKAIAEFLSAFRAVGHSDERLLLAGWINDTHWNAINGAFGDLVRSGRLQLLRRFLTQQEFQAALSALDVVCTPYPGFAGLSSTLLEGVAAGRPVLAHDYGWSAAAVRRFGLGWTCNVLDAGDFARALRRALDESDAYRPPEAVDRLLAFHSPENFVAHWTAGVLDAAQCPPRPVKTWEWVTDGLPSFRTSP